ncbi:MAG: hypothetical protein P1U57_02740 [Oleibacter sp.]|nr:hypothetical protein [Thalassolituus sp.]
MPSTISDQILSAFLDNELSATKHAEVKQALTESEELTERLNQLRQVDAIARAYYSSQDSDATQPHNEQLQALVALIEEADLTPSVTSNVVSISSAKRSLSWLQISSLSGIAASVALCALIFWPQDSSNQGIPVNALSAQLALSHTGDILQVKDGRSEIMGSWINEEGSFCRDLRWHTIEKSVPLSACFIDGNWAWDVKDIDSANYQTATAASERDYLTRQAENTWLKTITKP